MEGWFKDLNIFGDVQVEEALTQLRSVLNGTDYEALKDNEALEAAIGGPGGPGGRGGRQAGRRERHLRQLQAAD